MSANDQYLLQKIEHLKLEILRKEEVIRKLQGGSSQGDIAVSKDGSSEGDLAVSKDGSKKRRFRGRKPGTSKSIREFEMPRDLAENPELDDVIARTLPANYNFEIKKTLWRIRRAGATRVAIQLPEGLLIFSCPVADILEKFANVEVFILAEVTYGACCIDDFSARSLGCQLLVHYGHSCLIPVDLTARSPGSKADPEADIQVMYVFVDVSFDVDHLIESLKLEFPDKTEKLALMGTIQFAATLNQVKLALDKWYETPLEVPQVKPLSHGEVLGCTSPALSPDLDALVFVADGRFHLESAMIANPHVPALRYDPYSKAFTREAYDMPKMLTTRYSSIQKAREATTFGVILGVLGRQGNPKILERVLSEIRTAKPGAECMVILLSELTSEKLKKMESRVQAWIQIACPRLSIDWAEAFSSKPLLTPYELFVSLGSATWKNNEYPQDFYSNGSGPWTNYYSES